LVQRINRKLRREDEYEVGLQKTPKNNAQALSPWVITTCSIHAEISSCDAASTSRKWAGS
jgi:hypothetical protein